MNIRRTALSLILFLCCTSLAQSQTYYRSAPPPAKSKSLGIFGGLAGAGIGAAIGQEGGDALPGAAIGGAIGALSGAILGGAVDDEETRQNVYRQQQYEQQQQWAQRVSLTEVVSMSQAGLGDEVIINQIRTKGMAQTLTSNDLIVLKQQGVSDRVINAMQYQPQPTQVIRQVRPIVVQEHYYHPRPYRSYHHYHHGHHHHGHSGIHFRIGH